MAHWRSQQRDQQPNLRPDVARNRATIEADRAGIYHLVNEGYTSRHGWRAQSAASGRTQIPLTPISASDWPRPHCHRFTVLVNQTAAARASTSPRQQPPKNMLSELVSNPSHRRLTRRMNGRRNNRQRRNAASKESKIGSKCRAG